MRINNTEWRFHLPNYRIRVRITETDTIFPYDSWLSPISLLSLFWLWPRSRGGPFSYVTMLFGRSLILSFSRLVLALLIELRLLPTPTLSVPSRAFSFSSRTLFLETHHFNFIFLFCMTYTYITKSTSIIHKVLSRFLLVPCFWESIISTLYFVAWHTRKSPKLLLRLKWCFFVFFFFFLNLCLGQHHFNIIYFYLTHTYNTKNITLS